MQFEYKVYCRPGLLLSIPEIQELDHYGSRFLLHQGNILHPIAMALAVILKQHTPLLAIHQQLRVTLGQQPEQIVENPVAAGEIRACFANLLKHFHRCRHIFGIFCGSRLFTKHFKQPFLGVIRLERFWETSAQSVEHLLRFIQIRIRDLEGTFNIKPD